MARIEELIASAHGTQWIPLGSGYSVVRRYDKLDVRHGGRQRFVQYAAPLPVGDELVIPEAKLLVKTTWTRGIVKQRDGKPGLWPAEASLNADRVEKNALYVRSQRSGDRVRPPGMRGSKKLQDILVDQKVPRDVRRLVPVIVANEEIVWFPGYCVARGWEVPSQSARSLHLRIEPFC
jgi:tRNA(Ile)-lysidine synthetase-like protein